MGTNGPVSVLWKGLKCERMTIPSVCKDIVQLELSHIAGENAKWYGHSGEQSGSFLET